MKKKDFEITITVDTNDGDYNSLSSKISAETLELIKPLIEAIKNFEPYVTTKSDSAGEFSWTHHHNYPSGEWLPRRDLGEKSPEEIYPQFSGGVHEAFIDFCPHGEHGFHSIESVEVTPLVKKTKLL